MRRAVEPARREIIEQRTWHVTLMGGFGNYPLRDPEGFLAFAKGLHTPKLYDFITDAAQVEDLTTYRFPTSLRHHYERLTTVPEGLSVFRRRGCPHGGGH